MQKLNFNLIVLLISLIFSINSMAQMGINASGTAPNSQAMLDISSTTKGLLIPRMTTTQRSDILGPTTGLTVYDTDYKDYFYSNGLRWFKIFSNHSHSNTNVILGDDAMPNNNSATHNIAIGSNALRSHTYSGDGNNDQTRNIAIGSNALFSNNSTNNTNGRFNIAIGGNAMQENTIGSYNLALGNDALNENINGFYNYAVGSQALGKNTLGSSNLAIGSFALHTSLAKSYNLAIGHAALRNFDNSATPALTFNTAIGHNSIQGSVTSSDNTGIQNTALGYNSMLDNTSGSNNLALGYNTLSKNTTGNFITAVGTQALQNNAAINRNTAIGYGAMERSDNSTTSTDAFNTAIGVFAMRGSSTPANNTGKRNVAIGDLALTGFTIGSDNVMIGNSAGSANTTGSGNIYIGNQAGGGQSTASNQLIIENSNADQALLRGDFTGNKLGVNFTKATFDANAATFQVNGTASNTAGGNWLVNSDKRLKKNITSLNSQEILAKVLKLRGVNYEWNDEDSGKIRPKGTQFGFIAQEIQEIFPAKVSADANGILSATYGDFDPMLVESIKALKQLIDDQKKIIENQNNRINLLEANILAGLKAEK
jgi:trimeric autotransporter adhesin